MVEVLKDLANARTLEGKVALVTGGGRGLGRACATLLAREGAKVVVVDFNPEVGREACDAIEAAGGEALYHQADISKEDEVEAMVAAAVARFGQLDCAINNAVKATARLPLADIEEDDWDAAMAVNSTGVFLCMKHEIRSMLKTGGGSIVNIGSGNEHSAKPGLACYLAAKQGLYGMTKVAALDYATQNIRVNAVGPGTMWTPLMRQTAQENPGHLDRLTSYTPMRRIAEPEEVAEAAVWLCTPRASYVFGHTLLADGGAVLG